MDKSEVRRIVEENLTWMRHALGVAHWKIEVSYSALPSGTQGYVERNINYDKAWIELDPAQHSTEAQVLESLRHELLHLLVTPFDLYNRLANEAVSHDSHLQGVLEKGFDHAQERAVRALEVMLDHGLGWQYQDAMYRGGTSA